MAVGAAAALGVRAVGGVRRAVKVPVHRVVRVEDAARVPLLRRDEAAAGDGADDVEIDARVGAALVEPVVGLAGPCVGHPERVVDREVAVPVAIDVERLEEGAVVGRPGQVVRTVDEDLRGREVEIGAQCEAHGRRGP